MTVIVTDESSLRRVVAEEVERVIGAVQKRASKATARSEALLTGEQLSRLLNIDRRTLRRMVLAGTIPAPLELGERTQRWRRETIEEWVLQAEMAAICQQGRSAW